MRNNIKFKYVYRVFLILVLGSLSLNTKADSEQLTKEFQVMLSSIEKNCSKYKEYYPYTSALKDLKEKGSVEKIPDYSYKGIFSSGFLNSSDADDCKPVVVDFAINGIDWLKKNRLIKKTDSFWNTIHRSQAKALVHKFYIKSNAKLLDKALNIVKQNYLEHYTESEYQKLSAKNKKGLKQSSNSSNYRYYDPGSYYLATMTFSPEIGVTVSSNDLEVLLERTQVFENKLIDMVTEPFDNHESATLNIFSNLLSNYKNNLKKYGQWSQRAKEHILSLKQRDYLNQNSCNHLNKFYEETGYVKTSYKETLRTWLKNFYKNNCNNVMPIDKFMKEFTLRHPKDIIDKSDLLRQEMLRHAKNDLWKYARLYKNSNICDILEFNANSDSIIKILVENKDYWQQFKSTFCKKTN